MTMERKIGEIFEYNGEWYQCIIGHCNQCSFDEAGTCKFIGNPYCAARNDKELVCFKKLEKVGDTYSCNYYGDNRLIMMQEYNLFNLDDVTNEDKIPMYITDYKHKRIAIEIKQTKEDMEEKKLNLKPFDIQKAREGKPVCTRDGRKARIIVFDRRLFYKNVSYPILALVERSDGEDDVCGYNEKGKVLIEDGAEYKDDLMMLPEKKEGWVNVYKNLGVISLSHNPYDTKEEALASKMESPVLNKYYVDTVKVEWEE